MACRRNGAVTVNCNLNAVLMNITGHICGRLAVVMLAVSFFCVDVSGQNGGKSMQFLNIPVSARAAALGGENISIVEDDYTLASQNPALLACVSDKNISLNYMNYIKGVNIANAGYSSFINDRLGWAVSATYMDYGKMTKADVAGIKAGTFGAKDMSFNATFAYEFNDYWSGGVAGKVIYSHYDSFSSFGMGIDLGLNYYNESNDFSLSLTARNMGGQIVSFNGKREAMPFNLLLGFSKRLAHAPLRVSVTMQDLTNWETSAASQADGKKEKGLTKLLNHFVIGLDFLPTKNVYVALGYNLKRANEMKINGSGHMAGFSAGAGVSIRSFKVGASYARYHVAGSSLLVNLALALR